MIDYFAIIGKSYVFEDSASIRVMQVKQRDTGMWVTYETDYGQGLPKRTVMPYEEFIDTYGHLFEDK